MCSSDLALENTTLLKTAVLALLAVLLATEIGLMNRILDTVNLSIDQWLVCAAASIPVLLLSEIKKALKIRTDAPPVRVAVEPVPAAA